ncbi:o-succinylbenzoate synthase [Longibacter sp.]|uniref:o-succinylbenzoate synthase n=1 Tax=Longibacter sp. TaxID=2045415 RepID=UPI003EBBEB91
MAVIESVTLHPYVLPLTSPVDLGGFRLSVRKGCLVRVRMRQGSAHTSGLGDIAPLPHFSRESLSDAREAVEAQIPNLVGRELPASPSLRDLDRVIAEDAGECPSAQFGLEQALTTAIARHAGVPLSKWLSETARDRVPLNALLTGTPDEIVAAGVDLDVGEYGYRAVKIKVGRHDPAEEAAAVRHLHGVWGGDVDIRLDANRAWSRADAEGFVAALNDTPIAYIEEPLTEASDLRRWAGKTGVPVALDETTRELSVEELARQTFAAAFVIKPSLLGFYRTLDLAREVASAGVDLVITSAYESGIGLAGLAALATAIGTRPIPAGLDTYQRLSRDVVEARLPIGGPSIHVSALWEALPSDL